MIILGHRLIREIRERYGHHVLRTMRIVMPLLMLFLLAYFGPSCWEAWRSGGYASTEGTIVRIAGGKSVFDGTVTVTLHFEYDYEVKGRRFRGERYDPFGDMEVRLPEGSWQREMEPLARVWHEGATVPVWYDPANPTRAFLSRGWKTLDGRWDDVSMILAGFVVSIVLWSIPVREPKRTAP